MTTAAAETQPPYFKPPYFKRIDLKNLIAILAFFGLGSLGSWWIGLQRVGVFVLAPAFDKNSREDSARAAAMVIAGDSAVAEQIMQYMDRRFDRLEGYVTRIPAVQKSFTVEERSRIEAEQLRTKKELMFPRTPLKWRQLNGPIR